MMATTMQRSQSVGRAEPGSPPPLGIILISVERATATLAEARRLLVDMNQILCGEQRGLTAEPPASSLPNFPVAGGILRTLYSAVSELTNVSDALSHEVHAIAFTFRSE